MSLPMTLQLKTSSLNIGYDRKVLIADIDFSLSRYEALLIKGPNGSGKTTFLKTLLGLIPPISGTIIFFDASGSSITRPAIGYLPQLSHLDRQFPICVGEVIESGLPIAKRSTQRQQRVVSVADLLRITNLLPRPIAELSGGQLQRALLARAIVAKPDLLILDEPNAYLDEESRCVFYEALLHLSESSSILMVSHESPPSNGIRWRDGF